MRNQNTEQLFGYLVIGVCFLVAAICGEWQLAAISIFLGALVGVIFGPFSGVCTQFLNWLMKPRKE